MHASEPMRRSPRDRKSSDTRIFVLMPEIQVPWRSRGISSFLPMYQLLGPETRLLHALSSIACHSPSHMHMPWIDHGLSFNISCPSVCLLPSNTEALVGISALCKMLAKFNIKCSIPVNRNRAFDIIILQNYFTLHWYHQYGAQQRHS